MSQNSGNTDYQSLMKKAVLELREMRAKLSTLERAKTEPIAIVGMGCRFPGGADNPAAFWELLRDGVDAITEVPSERWDIDAYYDSNPDAPGKMYTRYGGFVNRLHEFDPQFFGLSPREAVSLDPQQRLLLEVSWEALEHSGLSPDQLVGSKTGVFIGICSNDYSQLLLSGELTDIDAYMGTGNSHSVAAGRLSYILGLQGPSLAVDTACSSSLVTVHLACQSLRNGESDLALAGGVNRILSPEVTINFSKARMLAADGRCKTFDAAADGYVRGEGCGVIVLKRLCDAVADGDNILALIRGSAVNQDGRSSGLTVPNGPSQQALIRQALENSGVESSQVSYIEAHGTGTSLGDPMELGALGAVFGKGRPQDQSLVIGSVKTNIGHLEAAAGIAGLIKVVLSLQHEEIPPHLHFQQPNPHIFWDQLPVVIPTQRMPWPSGERQRIAGVSSFGFSGTNAHVVLEDAPIPPVQGSVQRPLHLLTLSAKTEDALKQLASRYENYLAANPNLAIEDICFTANTGRSHFSHRLSAIADSSAQLSEKLAAFTAGIEAAGVKQGRVQGKTQPKVAFLFRGEGSQYVGMGRQLYETEPTFRASLDQANEILRPDLERPLLEVLYPSEGEMGGQRGRGAEGQRGRGAEGLLCRGAEGQGEIVYAQTALFALEYALAELWKSWGIKPSVVMGHGVGEYVAACVAGIFSLEDGLKLIASRAGLIKTAFEQVAADVAYSFPRIELISNLTGGQASNEIATPEYWVSHLQQQVAFATTTETQHLQGYEVFVEIGPLPAWQWSQVVGRKGEQDWQFLLQILEKLYLRGVPVDWSGFDRHDPRRRLQLPTYPFQRQRYWTETAEVKYHKTRALSNNGARSKILHPLLGQRIHSALKEIQFSSQISQDAPAFLEHHRVFQTAILPATAYLEMVLAAGATLFKSNNLVLEQVLIQQSLILPEDEAKTLQLILIPEESRGYSFQIFSFTTDEDDSEGAWTLHACGKVLEQGSRGAEGQRGGGAEGLQGRGERELLSGELATLQGRYTEEISVKDYYQEFRKRGIDYGSSFQAIERLWRHDGKALGEIRLPEELVADAGDYQLHPVLLDACFQVLGATFPENSRDETWVPVGLERLCVYSRTTTRLWSHVQMRPVLGSNQQTLSADLSLFAEDGQLIAAVEGLQLGSSSREALLGTPQESVLDWLYEVEWRPQVLHSQQLPPDYMPAPKQISDRLRPLVATLISQSGLEVYAEVLVQLEALSVAYVLRAFRQMGWDFQPYLRFSIANIAEQLGVVSQHQRLLGRLLEMLAEVGLLRQTGFEWEVASVPEIQDPQEQINTLVAQYPAGVAELTLLGRCGSRLAEVLRGECDPLQLLFPAGDLTTATQLYQDSPGARVMNTVVQKAVLSAVERLPQGRGVRVLEIGAGTGGTTSYLLPHLSAAQTEYIFTDVSPLFTTQAQEKFRDYSFVRYQLLDIEQAPETQGFGGDQFDLIVAANVLHATKDLRQTLQHVRSLLAPGGMLVLLEGTARLRWVDLIFGLTEGWWKFADVDLRPDYPLLCASQWQEVLLETGFEAAVTISPDQESQGALFQQAVIVAQATQAKPEAASSQPKSWLIFADAQGTGDQLATLLRERGELCTLVFPSKKYEQLAEQFRINPTSPADFQQLLKAVKTDQFPLRGVVYLWSLDAVGGLDLGAAAQKLCGSTLHLVQSLVGGFSQPPSMWLVTRGAQPVGVSNVPGVAQSPLWGMGKVIALEHPELKCVRVDLDPDAAGDEAKTLFEEIWSEDAEDQVAFRDQVRHVARLVRSRHAESVVQRLEVPHSQSFQLGICTRGTLENLELQPTTRREPGAGEVEIRVHATGLNFRDVLNALGVYPGEPPFGAECAGEVVAIGEGVEGFREGDPVLAIAPGSFSQYVTVNAAMVAPKPETLSFEEAATVPVAFLTAYYTLHHLAKISAGDRVLIHAATGGVGQAAVQLAQQAGAEVFGTASSGKWEFLNSLGVKHIMNSRTLDFASEVMDFTQDQGVDIVLNCLAGEFIPKSLSVLRAKGRFLEIGKSGVWDADRVVTLRPDVSYFPVDLVQVCQQQPALIQSMLRQLMQQLKAGLIKPLPLHVFPIHDVVSAFRYMQQAKHMGKIVVSGQSEPVVTTPPLTFRGDSTYLITGGMGGLGLLMARWMVEKGARYLVLVGRSGASSGLSSQMKELEQAGAKVVVAQADVSSVEQVAGVLTEIEQSLPPLRGIVHAAGLLDDGVLMQLSWERIARVMAPKVEGAWNLHTLTQNMPIDFFVLFSSAASLLASPGQANHAAANAFLDALAYSRRAQGLQGLSINWGAWADIGAAAKRQAGERMKMKGIGTISPQQGLEVLEQILTTSSAQVGVVPINWSQFKHQLAASPFLANFTPASGESGQNSEFLQQLAEVPAEERRAYLLAYVSSEVAKVLGLDPAEPIDLQQGFFDLGMDSLTSLELRNRLQTSLGYSMPLTLAFDYPTVEAFVDYLATEVLSIEFSHESALNTESNNHGQVVAQSNLEDLSDSEAEALLLSKLESMRY